MQKISLSFLAFLMCSILYAQNFNFNFNNNGRRVCLVESEVNLTTHAVTIKILDASSNTTEPISIFRRQQNTTTWTPIATNLPASTTSFTDNAVSVGDVWEYQVKRFNTWSFGGNNYDAIGYTMGVIAKDQSGYMGQMILLVANDVTTNLSAKYLRLKKELTAEGWFVNEVITARATDWNSGNAVVTIKNQIQTIYNNAASNDKPKIIFILGHVPLPRSGSTNVTTPDEHDENKGARGCDAYYADIDGLYTDVATYNPGGLATPLAINLPGDFKWDQDFFPSNIEMAFGRIDFADLNYPTAEIELIENYLDRLSNYKNVTTGFNMGNNTGFFFGYDNSNDGSYRSLPNISKAANLFQNNTSLPHPQWVQNNGPFKMYMQNIEVPNITQWETYGMNATVFSSDQSYWGFGDVPQSGLYSTIRTLLAPSSKCLVTLWTTTGINIFHQACSGIPFGIAMKDIMNHNQVNQLVQKAPQLYDTEDWWNRTHFAFYGDPTVRLYQVSAATNLNINAVNNFATLQWTASSSTNILGYNIYEGTSEFGIFNKINNSPITTTSYNITNHQTGNWYMVKAIKMLESGCGKFIHPSIGIAIQSNVVLPITLVSFTAKQNKQAVDLWWSTSYEYNNKGFEIQKSADGINFEKFNFIQSAGNNNTLQDYKTTDELPFLGKNFYRLKQIDNDGRFTYSNIQMVEFKKENAWSIYPNPVKNNLYVNGIVTNTIFSISNIYGQVVMAASASQNKPIDLSNLSKGIYFIKINESVEKFVKD